MDSFDDLMDEGNGALAIGEKEEAIKHFRAATQLDGNSAEAWIALTMALYKNDQYIEAIQAGSQAAELDPNNQFVWSSLSLAYNANKQKTEAEAAGAKARIISWGGKIKKPSEDSEPPRSP